METGSEILWDTRTFKSSSVEGHVGGRWWSSEHQESVSPPRRQLHCHKLFEVNYFEIKESIWTRGLQFQVVSFELVAGTFGLIAANSALSVGVTTHPPPKTRWQAALDSSPQSRCSFLEQGGGVLDKNTPPSNYLVLCSDYCLSAFDHWGADTGAGCHCFIQAYQLKWLPRDFKK